MGSPRVSSQSYHRLRLSSNASWREGSQINALSAQSKSKRAANAKTTSAQSSDAAETAVHSVPSRRSQLSLHNTRSHSSAVDQLDFPGGANDLSSLAHAIEVDSLDFPLDGLDIADFQTQSPEAERDGGHALKQLKRDFSVRAQDSLLGLQDAAAGLIYRSLSQQQSKSIQQAEKLLQIHAGEAFQRLDNQQKLAVLRLLVELDLEPVALMQAEVQNRPQLEAGAAQRMTGSGRFGHFVHSSLTSLSTLMRDNRLTPELVNALTALQRAELHPALDRQDLILSTLQNIALPHSINQHGRGTCVAATAEIMLALRAPEQYIRIVQDLASPAGRVQSDNLPGWSPEAEAMQREAGTEQMDDSGRSVASRLVQPAFIEYGNGALNYDNVLDRHFPAPGSSEEHNLTGLTTSQSEYLLQGLLGVQHIESMLSENMEGGSPEFYPRLMRTLAAGQAVPVGVDLDPTAAAYHKMLLTAVDADKQLAYLMNPWGELNTVDLGFFKDNVTSAQFFVGVGEVGELPDSASAMAQLPEAAARPEHYLKLLESTPQGGFELINRGFSENILLSSAAVLRRMDSSQIHALRSAFKGAQIPWGELDRIHRLCESGPVPELLLLRLRQADSPQVGVKLIRLLEHMRLLDLPASLQAQVLALKPEETLSTRDFERLMTAIHNGRDDQIQQMLDIALENEGLDWARSELELRDALQALLPERGSPEVQDQLTLMLNQAAPGLRGEVLNQLLAAGEDAEAMDVELVLDVISTSPPEEFFELMTQIHPYELGEMLQEPAQVSEMLYQYLNSEMIDQTREWNCRVLLEGYLERGDAAEMSTIVDALVHRLDDRQLAQLPPATRLLLSDHAEGWAAAQLQSTLLLR